MTRQVPHKGYFIKVEATCDRMGVCCIKPVSKRHKGRICGMDYKIPWDDFNMTRHEIEHSGGWPVRKLVSVMSWSEMVDAWGDTAEGGGGLFGGRIQRRRY